MIDYHTFVRSKPCMSSMDSLSLRLLPPCPRSAHRRLLAAPKRFRPRQSTPRASKLDPFKLQIVHMLEKYPIVPHKSCSTYASRALRAATPRSKPTCELSPQRQSRFSQTCLCSGRVRPSRLGLVRLGPVGQTRRRLSFFVMVLCYSRRMYVEFTVSQTMEHFLACHQHALETFKGCPSDGHGRQSQIRRAQARSG